MCTCVYALCVCVYVCVHVCVCVCVCMCVCVYLMHLVHNVMNYYYYYYVCVCTAPDKDDSVVDTIQRGSEGTDRDDVIAEVSCMYYY